jgi:hypothetical protein
VHGCLTEQTNVHGAHPWRCATDFITSLFHLSHTPIPPGAFVTELSSCLLDLSTWTIRTRTCPSKPKFFARGDLRRKFCGGHLVFLVDHGRSRESPSGTPCGGVRAASWQDRVKVMRSFAGRMVIRLITACKSGERPGVILGGNAGPTSQVDR